MTYCRCDKELVASAEDMVVCYIVLALCFHLPFGKGVRYLFSDLRLSQIINFCIL